MAQVCLTMIQQTDFASKQIRRQYSQRIRKIISQNNIKKIDNTPSIPSKKFSHKKILVTNIGLLKKKKTDCIGYEVAMLLG